MVEFSGHDYHNCGCSRCARLREQEAKQDEWEKTNAPNKYRERKGLEIKAWFFVGGFIFMFIFTGIGWIFFDSWGAVLFFIISIIILIRILTYDFGKDVPIPK